MELSGAKHSSMGYSIALGDQAYRTELERRRRASSACFNPWMVPQLSSLQINASLLNALRVPLKTIQERLGHALSGSLRLDVYTHAEWPENVEAAKLAGEQIEKAVNSVSLTANLQDFC
jgi:hypothetical protein